MTKKQKPDLPSKAPKRTGKRGIGPKPDDDEVKQRGKTSRLPGMEDSHLADLEENALAYADVRDKRMALTRKESDLKDVLLTLMKRHGKTTYRVEEMEIKVVAKDETVKVKILSDDEEN